MRKSEREAPSTAEPSAESTGKDQRRKITPLAALRKVLHKSHSFVGLIQDTCRLTAQRRLLDKPRFKSCLCS